MDDLRVRVIGVFEIDGLATPSLGSRKARRFLKLLAMEAGRPVAADRAIDVVWGDRPPAKPADQLSVLASRLRSILGRDRITRGDAGYTLHADWVDRDEVERLAMLASERLAAGSPAAAGAAAGAALHLVRGPLLADELDAPWIDADRLAVEQLVSRVVAVAAEAELAGGDPIAAAVLAERALGHDPYDERALRLLMTAHRRAGRPASGLAAYARMREVLAEELGVSPTAETEALHTAILLDDDGNTGAGAGTSGDSSVPVDPTPVPMARLVGRSAELAALDTEFGRVRSGEVRLVEVDGEAGIGKTMMIDAWATARRANGIPVLRGTCDELGRQLPLQSIADGLVGHLRSLEPEAEAALLGDEGRVLAPVLGFAPTEAGEDLMPISGPGAAPTASDGAGAVEGGDGQAALFSALLVVLGRVASTHGAVLVLDDLHHAGESTRAWIRFAQRRGARGPLLIVAAVRDGTEGLLDPDARYHLGVLDYAAVAELCDSAGADRTDELLARSGGHPLFLVELLASPSNELPPSIKAAVASRRRELGEAGTTIEAAAVVGPQVDLDLLAAVLDRPPLDVLADLESGVAHGVLDELGAGFAFRHALVRDALVADVSGSRSSFVHREAAHHLAARRGAAEADPLEIANHARLGSEPELASRALTAAARVAVVRFDYNEADRLLVDAVEQYETAEAHRQRGLVALAVGRYDDALREAQASIELGGGAPALELAGWAAYYGRDFVAARGYAEEGARQAEAPIIAAGCQLVAGRVLHADGDLPAADARLSAAVERVGARLRVGPIWLAALRIHQSRSVEALGLLDLVAGRPAGPDEGDHPFADIHRHLNAGYAHATLGHAADALAAFDRTRVQIERQGQVERFRGRLENWSGWVLRYLGATDAADASNQAGLDVAAANALPEPQAHALLDLADGSLLRGDLGEASAFLDRAEPFHLGTHAMHWRHELRARLLRARLAQQAGDAKVARDHTTAVRGVAEAQGLQRYLVFADLIDALASHRTGQALDYGTVDAALRRLPTVAGLEAWWWTDALASATGTDAWRVLADQRGLELVAGAGSHADMVRARLARGR